MKMHTKPYTLHLKEFRDVPLNTGTKTGIVPSCTTSGSFTDLGGLGILSK